MKKTRILIVEDEAVVAQDISIQLTGSGYEPLTQTATGEEALVMVGQLRPDLVLMDVRLSGSLDGIATAQIIRERFSIPVVFLTAFLEDAILDRAKTTQPYGYLTKPFQSTELRMVIDVALIRHQAETQISRMYEEHAAVLRTAMDGFWIVDTQGRLLDVNDAYCRTIGYTRDELLHMSIADLDADKSPDQIASNINRIKETGCSRFERRHRHKDGSIIDVEASVNYLPTSGGRFFCFLRDITEHKRMDESLRLNSEIMANMADGVFLIRLSDGIIVQANDRFERMFGYDHGELIGQPVSVVNAPSEKTPQETAKEIIEKLKRNGAWTGEVLNVKKDGTTFWSSASVSTFEDHNHGTVWIAVHRDITDYKRFEEALKQSKNRLELACQAAGAGTWDWDMTCHRLDWSSELYTLFGLDPHGVEATFDTWIHVLHPDDRANAAYRLEQAIKEKIPLINDYRIIHPDGQVRWISALGNTTYDPSSQPVRMTGICIDITERKQSEAELHRKTALLEAQLNSTADGILIVDSQGKKVLQNQRTIDMWKIPKHIADNNDDEAQVKHVMHRTRHPERFVEQISHLYSHPDETSKDEIELTDGTVFDRYSAPVLGKDGQNYGRIWTFHDITESKRAEQNYRMLFREMLDGFALHEIICDEQGNPVDYRFLAINPAFERLTGLKTEEVVGRTVLEAMPSTEKHWIETYGKVALTGKPIFFENYAAELKKYFEVKAFRPAPKQFACIFADITERKHLEDKLRQAQKMEAIGQLAGGVAHDFNNIMAATMMQLSFLKRNTSLDQEAQEMLNELMAGAKQAARLTAQLLMFSRRSVLEIKVLDLNEVVTNLLKMLSRLIGEHISLRFDCCEALPAVEADTHMIEQVVMNLAVNARDAMPKGGMLTIRLESLQIDAQPAKGKNEVQPGRFVCLSVADTGCGMDKATLKCIFEPFFTTKEVGKGTGLGLATVDGIVAQHKGWVDVESELGLGTTFKVYFPVSTKRTTPTTQMGKQGVVRGHETILLVEDEASLRRLVVQGLRQMGYSVLEADNGQTAMKLWQECGQQIELLFSDMVMPEGMTGLDLAEKLRADKPNLKVIISSGYNMEMAGQVSPTAGGIVYFQKPYEFEVLSKIVRDCLDRA